jgi:hypothetical protein
MFSHLFSREEVVMSTNWVRRCAVLSALLAMSTVVSGDPPPASTTTSPVKAEQTPDERIQAALDSRQPFECKDLPITELPALLQKQYKIPVILDALRIEETGKKETTLTLTTKTASLRSCLALLLRPHELDYTIANEALVITTRESVWTNLRTELLYVGDLTAAPKRRPGELLFDEGSGHDEKSLSELITTTIQPPSWDVAGGPGTAHVADDLLVVTHTAETIGNVKKLLAALREAKRQGTPVEPGKTYIALDNGGADLLAALDRTAKLSVVEASLDEVVKKLSSASGVPFVLNMVRLEEAGKSPDQVFSVDLTDMSLRSVLRHTLGPHDLAFFVRDDHITITTREELNETLDVRIYPVRDLMAPDRTGAEPSSYVRLMELVFRTIKPSSWDAAGGSGNLRGFDPAGVLVVTQTQEVHEQVAGLLAQLRNLRKNDALEKKAGDTNASSSQMTVRVHSNNLPAEVAEIVRELIEPDSWKREPQAYIRELPGRLVVRHRPAVHRQIAVLLEKLAAPEGSGGSGGGGAPF